MDFIILFTFILFFSLVGPSVFKRMGIPYAVALILLGYFMGPHGIQAIPIDKTLHDFSIIGLLFLMFSAGLEIKMDVVRKVGRSALIISFFNGLIPFFVGMWIAGGLGLEYPANYLLGVLFVSSSVGIVVPTLIELGVFKTDLGRLVISSVVLQDILSLVGLTFILQTVAQTGKVNDPYSYFLLISAFLFTVLYFVPKLTKKYIKSFHEEDEDVFERKFRFIFITLLFVTFIAEVFGLHLIIAAFITGIACSAAVDKRMEEKFNTVGYGVFVPIFFFFIGMETDFSVVLSSSSIRVPALIIAGLIFSKIISGFIGAMFAGREIIESFAVGSATIPQLSTTLATAQLGREVGIFSEDMLTSIVILSLVTTSLSPILVRYFLRMQKEYRDVEERHKKEDLDDIMHSRLIYYGKKHLLKKSKLM